jgi:hypothetical protein
MCRTSNPLLGDADGSTAAPAWRCPMPGEESAQDETLGAVLAALARIRASVQTPSLDREFAKECS